MSVRRIKIRSKKRVAAREPDGWAFAKRWLVTGTMVAYSTVGTGKLALAQQAGAGGASAPPQSRTLTVILFDIPAGPLSEVTKAFERATGLKVNASQSEVLSVQSPGVTGPLTVDSALRQMLAATGVTHTFRDAKTVVLQIRSSSQVDVVGTPEVSSPKYTAPLRDLPQTISIIPKAVIEQQGATTLRDVLRNVPGLTMTAGEGGTPAGDNLTLRGYNARNDIFVDGVRDLSSQSRDPFNLEQVEVTKGPTSAVSGRGSAGGTINLVSKSPNLTRGLGGSFSLGNADQRRGSIDINTPLTALNERMAFRMNALWHQSGVPGRDIVKNDRWGLAPSLAFGLGTRTRTTLSYAKLKQDNISDYGIPWVPVTSNALAAYRDQAAPVPRNTFYGYANRDREVLNQDTFTGKVEHDFTDNYQLRTQFRYGKGGRNSVASTPRLQNNDSTVVTREMKSWIAKDTILDSTTDLRASFSTGPIKHTAVVGAAFTSENNLRTLRTGPNSSTTLLNPNANDLYTGLITVNPFIGDLTGNTQSLYAFDTAQLGSHFEATGGLRWEHFKVNGVNNTPAPVTQDVKMSSVRAGLIYKPVRSGSIYASYGTSLSPSLEGLSYSVSNTAIPPEKTYTTEAGVKWDLLGNRVLLSSAVFRVAKDNARTPGILPTDPPQVLAGQQVSKGFEISATGNVTRKLQVLGAYTLIDARINGSNNPLEVGRFFQNTPKHSVSLWATYSLRKLTFGLGPRYVSQRYGNNINTRIAPAYWTMDAMASFPVNAHLDLRLNLTNLNDAFYYDRLSGGHIVPGQSRAVLVTTNFRF